MRLRSVATIVTALVIIVGFAMISPLFYAPTTEENSEQQVMLSFAVSKTDGAIDWCESVSTILFKYDLPATVFFVGEVAEQNPSAVTCFNDKVAIGSQTYSNVDLSSLSDYSQKLWEVQQGKLAVDQAGNINSKVFRTSKSTDADIYSLLSRSNITADFSYNNQYNVYQNDRFVKVEAKVFEAHGHSPDYFLIKAQSSKPIIIEFDNSWLPSEIDSFLMQLKTGDFEFVNASQLITQLTGGI